MLDQGFEDQSCSGFSADQEWATLTQVDEAIVIYQFLADVSRNKNNGLDY